MPSASLGLWTTVRAATFDEIEAAHASVGGVGRGRRYATQQINQAYVVLVSSHFQGFCRDLHSECADALVRAVFPAVLRPAVRAEFLRDRKLKQGNANPGNIGADFGRLGVAFWPAVLALDKRNRERQNKLGRMNDWRNAIAHQDFDPARLGHSTTLRLAEVRDGRAACDRLADSFDEAMHAYLLPVTGAAPWQKE